MEYWFIHVGFSFIQNSFSSFGVDGIAVFVYFDVGYSVISLKWCGILVLENSAVNGFSTWRHGIRYCQRNFRIFERIRCVSYEGSEVMDEVTI